MSEILIGQDLDNPESATVLPDTAERKAKQVPDPVTYHLLCVVPDAEEQYESGIVKAETMGIRVKSM